MVIVLLRGLSQGEFQSGLAAAVDLWMCPAVSNVSRPKMLNPLRLKAKKATAFLSLIW
jgi:hypothetical protein